MRLSGEVPKPYLLLGGKPVLRHSIDSLSSHPKIHSVHIVIHPDHRELYEQATEGLELPDPVMGGETRQESVHHGLKSLVDINPQKVLIHDAARPGLTHALTDRLLEGLERYDAVIPVLPVTDTIKRVESTRVVETLPRMSLMAVQTPQAFHYQTLLDAHEKAEGKDYTDDAAVMEAVGREVHIVAGDEQNGKLTTIHDWQRLQSRYSGGMDIRTGIGFDVHRLVEHEAYTDVDEHYLTLCGVQIPGDWRLEGHSDADVALHAVVDALLGAIGQGDIGRHFPPSDTKWKNKPSCVFVEHACALIREAGARILNVDLTIICEEPKVSPYREAMQEQLAHMLAMDHDRINVKATTTETLGFTGRKEGIAAQAVATVMIT